MTELYNIRPIINVSKSIALVGNSDSLLAHDYSKEIDSYQDVMRFNFSNMLPTHTGTKTTIRWVNCPIDIHSAKQHTNITSDSQLAPYIRKLFVGPKVIAWDSIKDKLHLYSKDINVHKPNGLCTIKNVNDYLDTLPNIKGRFDLSLTKSWPRTGFQAILTCIRSNCTPHLYGFDITPKNVIYHYSKTQKYVTDNIVEHQVRAEVNILRELVDNNYVVVHI